MCDNVANLVVDYILCDFEAEIIKNDKELFCTQLDLCLSTFLPLILNYIRHRDTKQNYKSKGDDDKSQIISFGVVSIYTS
jgi:hypothetical protein